MTSGARTTGCSIRAFPNQVRTASSHSWSTSWQSASCWPTTPTLIEDIWAAFRWLSDLQPSAGMPDDEIERLYDELAIRQHLCSYTDAFDSKDLDRIVDHFEDDAILTTNRGVFPHREGIRGYYE